MAEVSVLEVLMHGERVGTLTRIAGDRNLFAFEDAYVRNPARATLSVSFKDDDGSLIVDFPTTRTRLPTFFANMLPEEWMRSYLARRAGVSPKREFFLLWALGQDLPGAVTIRPVDGIALPEEPRPARGGDGRDRRERALRFSLAGVQLKFSALRDATGGLTIPAEGIGGSWIVKLPSLRFKGVPENEYAMMTLARMIGMNVPDLNLVRLGDIDGLPDDLGELEGPALAVKRFDRTERGAVHIEDFAQVFGVYPEEKYKRASYKNIASVIAAEAGRDDIAEFVRRLVFNTLIGNADMHLKNWSLIYPDRRRAKLSPAYDFLSTVSYIQDDRMALNYARTKRMDEFSRDELLDLASKARLPERLALDAASETVARFHEVWAREKGNLPISKPVRDAVEANVARVPIASCR